MGHRLGGGMPLAMGMPPVNAKIVWCELQALNRAQVKLFACGLVQKGIDPLPDLFDHANPQ